MSDVEHARGRKVSSRMPTAKGLGGFYSWKNGAIDRIIPFSEVIKSMRARRSIIYVEQSRLARRPHV